MDLETVILSEVNQTEKDKYRIITHICGIWINGIDDLICKAEIETETGIDTYTLLIPCIK